MKTLIELRCPSCGASLEVEEDRETAFCQYCGKKILINDENAFTYRRIDEADIKRAETERMIQLKEMELDGKEQSRRKKETILWTAAAALLILIGIIMVCTGPKDKDDPGYMLILLGLCVGGWGTLERSASNKNKDKRKSRIQNGVKITSAIADAEGKNYELLETLLRNAGFSNITCVPMKDLNFLTARKNGQVDSLVIDGDEDIEKGNVYSPNATITITYHSQT